jgi:hypothetical protein
MLHFLLTHKKPMLTIRNARGNSFKHAEINPKKTLTLDLANHILKPKNGEYFYLKCLFNPMFSNTSPFSKKFLTLNAILRVKLSKPLNVRSTH